ASAAETTALTGKNIGVLTALALPPELPLWVDARVMAHESDILGGGSRAMKVDVSPAVFARLGAEVVEGLATEPGKQSASYVQFRCQVPRIHRRDKDATPGGEVGSEY